MVIADEWLNDGNTPFGEPWEDIYTHPINEHEDKIVMGFVAIFALTKYNEGDVNNIIFLAINNNDLNTIEIGRNVA